MDSATLDKLEEALRQQAHDLRARDRELDCLVRFSALVENEGLSLAEILQGTVELLPPAWYEPEIACARIVLRGQEFRTAGFQETAWRQAAAIVVHGQPAGMVEVSYHEERPARDEGPFLRQERSLLDAIALRLGRIVEQVQNRQAQQQVREKLQALFDILPIGISVLDGERNILLENAALKKVLAMSAEQLAGKQYLKLTYLRSDGTPMPPEEFPSVRAHREQRAIEDVEIGIVKEDGRTIWTGVSAAPLPFADWGVVVTTVDLTERKRAEEALRRSERRFRGVVERSQDGIVLTDEQGLVTEWNKAMEQITGRAAAEMLGRPIWEVQLELGLPEQRALQQPEELRTMMRDLLRTGQAPWLGRLMEREYLRPDGTRRFVEGVVFPIPTERGFLLGSVSRDVTARRQAERERERLVADVEQQRRQAEELSRILAAERDILQVVIENTRAHLAYLDPQFNFVWVNSTYAQGSGHRPEELVGRNHFDLFPHAENQAIFERARDSGQAVEFLAKPFEFADQPERGVTYWDWTLTPVKDRQGRVQGLVLSLVDVTERMRTQAQLRDLAGRLQVQHEIDQAILAARSLQEIADATLHYVQRLVPCRRASLALLEPGAQKALLIAVQADGQTTMPLGTYIPLDQVWFLEDLYQGRTHLVADLQSLDLPSPALRSLRDEGVRTYASVPLLAGGELVGSLNLGLGSPVDLTPERFAAVEGLAPALAVAIQQARLRQQLETALRQVRQDYAALVDSVDGIVWEADAYTFQFSFVSRQAERLLGYPLERWTAEPTFWRDHLHPDDREWAPRFCMEATRQQRDHEFEYRMLAANGRIVWLHDLVTVVVEAGRPTRLRGIMIDISEQKAVQEALLQSEKLAAIGTLAASLAHEINNPLQSIMGCLGLAEEARSEGRDVQRYLQVAREEVQRLSRITARMRDLHRPASGEREAVDLNALIGEVLALFGKRCEERRIGVEWIPPADLPHPLLARDQVRQVLINLILNAIEAMPGGGQLEVRAAATAEPAGVSVEFRDSGVGITPEEMEHLFEPFHSTKAEGSGLGLFTSYNIVRQHGGTITVQSRPNAGSSFRVWLPLSPPQTEAALPGGER